MTPLQDIVAAMKIDAGQSGLATIKLSRGLELSLSDQDGECTLLIARRDAPPSEREVIIVRGAFDVPSTVEAKQYTQGRMHYVRVSWQATQKPPVTRWTKPAKNGNQWIYHSTNGKEQA